MTMLLFVTLGWLYANVLRSRPQAVVTDQQVAVNGALSPLTRTFVTPHSGLSAPRALSHCGVGRMSLRAVRSNRPMVNSASQQTLPSWSRICCTNLAIFPLYESVQLRILRAGGS